MLVGLPGGHQPGKGVRGAGGAAQASGESAVKDGASVPQRQWEAFSALGEIDGLHHFW